MALDDVKKLIDAGKENGYLAYNEVNDLIPNDVRSPEDLDDVLATIGTLGIDVLERQPKLSSSVLKRRFEEEVEPGEELGLDLAPGAVEPTDDPVRIYLREMGGVPLLTREGEVDIAKRIERGQRRVLKDADESWIPVEANKPNLPASPDQHASTKASEPPESADGNFWFHSAIHASRTIHGLLLG